MPTQRGISGGDFGIRLRGAAEMRKFLKRLQREIGGKSSHRKGIAEKAIKIIQDRTRSGKDVDGRKFKKKADGTSTNLVKSGKMIGALKYKFSGNAIIIYVDNIDRRHIVAEVHQYGMISGRRGARFKQISREWFGLNQEEGNILIKEMTKALNDFIKKESFRFIATIQP